ncbi:MAG: hypothetical protein ACOZHQ_13630 [Thermodesulfobacteriota bacterium]
MNAKSWLPWLILAMLAMPAAGCASAEEKNAYLNAQLEALKLQKPILLLKARPGEQITLAGVEELSVHQPLGGAGGAGLIRQHQSEWAPVAREGLGLIATVGGIYYGGQVAVQLADSIGRSAGAHISGSFNNAGAQSPLSYYVGQNGAPAQNVSDRHDSVDDHSAPAAEQGLD